MSKSEDYLDDLLNSVSDINKRNNKKDIEGLLKSMDEPKEEHKEREKKKPSRRRDYGEQFVREFEQEVVNGSEDQFLRDFELELDAEAADIDESMGEDAPAEPVKAEEAAETGLPQESAEQQDASEVPDISSMMGEIRRKVGNEETADVSPDLSGEEIMVDTMEPPSDLAQPQEEIQQETSEEPQILDEENPAQDLMDILGMSKDGDLLDIGNMLQADESGELDMAQIFGEQSQQEDEQEDSQTRDEFERLGSIQELKDLADSKKKKEKKGFFARLSELLFGNEEEEQEKTPEEAALGSLSDENAQILKELDAPQKKKKEKKPKKEKKKEEKPKPKKAPKPKKEKKPKEKDTSPPLPKKPVILIGIMAASIFLLIMLGSSNLQYSADVQTAKESLQRKDYVEAFQLMAGNKIKGKDEKLYERARLLSAVQSEYQAYYNLSSVGQYDMALDALIRGYGRCFDEAEDAETYEVTEELEELKQQIAAVLQEEMKVGEQEALSLYELTDREEYTRGIHQILQNLELE